MVRWLIGIFAVMTLALGATQVFANGHNAGATVSGAPKQTQVSGSGAGNSGNASANDETEGDGASTGQNAAQTPSQAGGVQGQVTLSSHASDCAEAEEMTHGCAVSTAVHEAQDATPPGPERGIAVSTAARGADCSMLPDGAQAACEARVARPHPNADGTPGNQGATAAVASSGGGGKGKGKK